MGDLELICKCQQMAKKIRLDVINMTYEAYSTGAHIGGSLSLCEILAVLYTKFINFPGNLEYRDRLIFSKGHGAMALYSALAHKGIIDINLLHTFKKNGSLLSAHPSLNELPGIEFSSGSLGQGLSLAVGVGLALRRKNNTKSKIYVILGDGECNEGSVMESALSASHYLLDNIIVIIDANSLQYDGATKEIMNMEPFVDKWLSFGWDCVEIDGHNISTLINTLSIKHQKPLCIIARTIKGKGVSFIEGCKQYHNSILSESLFKLAIMEVNNS